MSYAEDETDVEGTVNGVTTTATGNGLISPLSLEKKNGAQGKGKM